MTSNTDDERWCEFCAEVIGEDEESVRATTPDETGYYPFAHGRCLERLDFAIWEKDFPPPKNTA